MLDTLNSLKTGHKLNVRLNRFVRKVITPVVLLAGLLMLVLLHFHGVLSVTTADNNLYRGITVYSAGQLEVSFQHNAGADRPAVLYGNISLLSYVDWNSTISVDGQVQSLWNNYHGYDQDDTKHQIFATTSGYGWQVIEVISLVNAHTVTVQYQFMAQHQGTAEPHHVVLNIVHVHRSWYQPRVNGTTFTAQELPGYLSDISSTTRPHPIGTLTVSVAGPHLAATPIAIDDAHGYAQPSGAVLSLATSMTTSYTIDNPPVDRLTPLGTETITFANSEAAGTPLPAIGTPTVP